jgi:hypothetical protein
MYLHNYFVGKLGWAIFCAIFAQTHLVALTAALAFSLQIKAK